MQKWCGSSSRAIRLSSDDEDDYDRSLSSGFGGCIFCLPRFNLNGDGNIRLSAEDATLDDYMDPNPTTTIEPLLDEYNNRDRDTAFGGAVLQNSQHFLSRNPFASANTTTLPSPQLTTTTTTITTMATEESQGSPKATTFRNGNIDDSYQEQSYHSFSVAAPRVEFFMEDDDDAEFLSDHRISAIIGDTEKLANKFKLFDAEMDTGNPLQSDNHLERDNGQLTQKYDTTRIEPFELGNTWSNNTDLDTADVNQQPQPFDVNGIDKQQNEVHDNPETNDSLCGLKSIDELPAKTINNDLDINGTNGLSTSVNDEYENAKYNYSQGDEDYAKYANVDQMESAEEGVASPHTSIPGHNTELTTSTPYNKSDTELTALSEPPSPIPALSTIPTEISSSRFPSAGLSRTTTQEKLLTPISPVYHTPDMSAQKQSIGYPTSSSDDITNSQPFLSNASISPDVTNSAAISSPARRDMVIENHRTEKRRPSVATVAHSILGDKLDDFTEKLTYIRRNIISSLDDSDNNDEQYITKSHQRHQLWRPRSRSMLQNSRRLSTEQLYSTNVEKPQQQQQLSTNHPQHSNSMLDTSPSFTKFFQQLSGNSDSASNHRQFGSSSFFASLAGHGTPSFSSDDSPIIPPQQSSDWSELRQHHQPPKRSRSTGALASSSTSSSRMSHLSRSFSNFDAPLQDVDEQQEVDYDDVFEFKKVIAMGKNVRNISEDIMANGKRLFNDFSTRMKNANADQMEHGQILTPSLSTTQQEQQQQSYRHQQ